MSTSVKYKVSPFAFCAGLAVMFLSVLAAQGASRSEMKSAGLSFLANAPVYFEANQGQEETGRFIARGAEYSILLDPTEAVLVLSQPDRDSSWSDGKMIGTKSLSSRAVRFVLQGANPGAPMTGLHEMPGRVNYLIGDDPNQWRTGIPLFTRVQVGQVYPGIDLIYYANQSAQLEYDFILQPAANPDRISFCVEGSDEVRVNSAGDLVIRIGSDEVRQQKPVIFQEVDGVRKSIEGGYQLAGRNTVRFKVGPYDRSLPLIIDPTLNFLTYLGGSRSERGWGVALDGSGNVYVAGEMLTKKFATPGAFQTNYQGGIGMFGDAFVAKYGAVSNELIYLTYIGGKTDDGAFDIAVDPEGHAFITGFTDSKNFPTTPTNSVLRPRNIGVENNAFKIPGVDAFVVELETNGASLVFSTLLGGTRRDFGKGIAIFGTDVYVAGITESTNFIPVPTNGFQTIFGGRQDGFVARITGGTNVVYCTFLGGTNMDSVEGLAVDLGGNAYITGSTVSTNFPIVNPLVINGVTLTNLNARTNFSGALDAFVTKLSPDGLSLVYSSYLGSTNNESGMNVVTDSSGNAYVTGYTTSTNFPTDTVTQPVSGATNFASHVFVTKIGPSGGNVIFSTQFGGSGADQGLGIATDNSGLIYLTGLTTSSNFFATNVLTAFNDFRSTNALVKSAKKTPNDVFFAVLDPAGTNFTYGAYLGGGKNDQANSITVDPAGTVAYLVGETFSTDLSVTNLVAPGLVQTRLGGVKKSKVSDAFVGKFLLP